MALGNFRPFTAVPGGSPNRTYWSQLAAVTSLPGEPVIMTAGALTECATDPAVVVGIIGSGMPINGFTGAVLNYPFVNGINPDRLTTVGDPVPFILNNEDQWWATDQLLSTDGTTFAVAPTVAACGGLASMLRLASGQWGLRSAGGTNNIWRIMDVLDARGRSLTTPWANAGTGVTTVFKLAGAVAGAVAPQ